jgi:tight adherence protein C
MVREHNSVLAESEKRLLIRMAKSLPAWVNSDHLTFTGAAAMLGIGACFWAGGGALLMVIPLLAVNWFGDSLDGTLARVRKQERPRYGYYVDHVLDAVGFAALFGGLMLLLMLPGGSLLLVPPALVGGWFGPDVWLAREGRLRQERIERDLPDFLDILAVTVRAGLGYRAALSRVADALGGPLGDEMLTALRQMELGASRRQAFLALRERSSSESLGAFVAAQLQAEELGVPLSQALNDIAEDMRRTMHQNARRRAARAAPRVSVIVTTLIVPGAMILILVGMLLGSDVTDSGLFGG